MNRIINGYNSVKVQIESDRQTVASTNGIAISNGIYDKDLEQDVVVAPASPMGMNKNGNQTLPYASWVDITNWVARANYPSTNIVNNALQVTQDHKALIKLELWTVFRESTGYHLFNAELLVNDVVIFRRAPGEGVAQNADWYQANTEQVVYLKAGDRVSVRVYTKFRPARTGGQVPVDGLLDASKTYLTLTPVTLGNQSFTTDLLFDENTKFFERTYGLSVGKDRNIDKSNSVGPVIAQSRLPMPVSPGMVANFGGTFTVSMHTSAQTDSAGNGTGTTFRVALWGRGKAVDEYGTDDTDIELMYFSAPISTGVGGAPSGFATFKVPTMTDVVIPDGIDSVYLVAAYQHTTTQEYASIEVSKTDYFATSYSDPYWIKLEIPVGETNTYKHPLSQTGAAFKNRKYFDRMTIAKELTFFGNSSSVTLNVYKASSDNVRGTLIGTYTAAANEKKTVVIDADSPKIEIVSSQDYWVESCRAIGYDTIGESQNALEAIAWQDISDPLSGIVANRYEYSVGKMQLSFVSDALANSNVLVPGKKVRMLVNHYGDSKLPIEADTYSVSYTESYGSEDYNVVFTGTIRDYKIRYDYKNRPFIEVTVEDSHRALQDSTGGYMYDLPIEYAPMLNGLGKPAIIDDLDVSGEWRNKTDSSKNQPSAFVDGMKVGESIEAMRNTNKGFVVVDKMDSIVYKSALNADSALVVADYFYRSDISYGKIEKGTDTERVINQVYPNEHRLDIEEFEKRTLGNTVPARVESIGTIKETSQWWYDTASVKAYGERRADFNVVRGTGEQQDIKNKNFGPSFHDWADAIMDDYVLAKNRISRIMIIPDNFRDLRDLSQLEILDAVTILYKNESHTVFIRRMEWTIVNNSVRLELFFTRESNGVAWCPSIPVGDPYTDLYFDTF